MSKASPTGKEAAKPPREDDIEWLLIHEDNYKPLSRRACVWSIAAAFLLPTILLCLCLVIDFGVGVKDPYEVLGIQNREDLTDDDVRKVFKLMAKRYHPDKFTNVPDKVVAQERMQAINNAYDLIKTKEKRHDFDVVWGGYNEALEPIFRIFDALNPEVASRMPHGLLTYFACPAVVEWKTHYVVSILVCTAVWAWHPIILTLHFYFHRRIHRYFARRELWKRVLAEGSSLTALFVYALLNIAIPVFYSELMFIDFFLGIAVVLGVVFWEKQLTKQQRQKFRNQMKRLKKSVTAPLEVLDLPPTEEQKFIDREMRRRDKKAEKLARKYGDFSMGDEY